MDENSSACKTNSKDSIVQDLIMELDDNLKCDINPDFSNIDFSSILCFTKFLHNIVIIKEDCTTFVIGYNVYGEISILLPQEEIPNLTQLEIKDQFGNLWYPTSAVCGDNYTLYMVSNVPKGYKKRLIYSAHKLRSKYPIFLNIEKANPIALFGGFYDCAAIDTEGAIIFIPQSTRKKPKKLIKQIFLPGGEKAVSLACGEETLYALGHSGQIFISNRAKGKKHRFIQIVEMSKINIIQISGIYYHFFALSNEGKIYGCGSDIDHKLGLGYDNGTTDSFTEITTLAKYKINGVYAGFNNSLFQTEEGKIFACGDDIKNLVDKDAHCEMYSPRETKIKSGASFCIADFKETEIFIGFNPEMTPNKTVKYEVKIGLFGGNEKTKIAQIFTHNINNNNESSLNNNNDYKYSISIEIVKLKLKTNIILVDESKYNVKNDRDIRLILYQQMQFLLFFFDVSNFTSSLNDLNHFYEEANDACKGDFTFAIAAYGGILPKSNEIKKKFKCKIFEVNINDMETVNKPFYYFLQTMNQTKEFIKSNKEHINPFINLNSKNINIGLFGEKTQLAFRYIYGEFYEQFYLNCKNNFSEADLIKVININNQIVNVAVIDSFFIDSIDKSYYAAVDGLIFVLNISILQSDDFIEKINNIYNDAKEAVKGQLFFEIALFINEKEKIQINNQIEKIVQIKNEFNCRVWPFSLKTGENINEMFYFLAKEIVGYNKLLKKPQNKKH